MSTQGPLVDEVMVRKGNAVFFRLRGGAGRYLSQSGLVGTNDGRLHLVTVWSQGAHSEILFVHDLNAEGTPEARLVRSCTTTSAYSMNLDLSKAHQGTLTIRASTYDRGVATSVCSLSDPDPVLAAGDVFRDCDTCPEMVVIPAGAFWMGSIRDEAEDDEQPRHRVSVERFALGRYEVTRAEYAAFVSATGHDVSAGCSVLGYDADDGNIAWFGDGNASWRSPGFSQGGDHPVVCVSWRDAQAFVEWLSRETGERYRLPSGAEWEYAARAGTATRRWWGDEAGAQQCEYANGADATFEQMLRRLRDQNWNGPAECTDGSAWTAPVGSFSPNDFGLHDVLGNVREWVEDCWHETYSRAPADGSAWTSGGDCGRRRRVLRGGSWSNIPRFLRSATRGWGTTGFRSDAIGFRVSRTLD